MLNMLGEIFADDILKYFLFFFQKTRFDISCKLSPVVCMKYAWNVKSCFLGKKKKINIDLASAEFVQRVVMINPSPAEPRYALALQTVKTQITWLLKKPTDLDLHCLTLSMRIRIKQLDQAI